MIASAKTYGELRLVRNKWELRCDPHVSMMAKRVFGRIPHAATGVFEFSNTLEICADLKWFTDRYPLDCPDMMVLKEMAEAHKDRVLRLSEVISGKAPPRKFSLAEKPREYQRLGATVYLESRSLLLADEVGLGKTCMAICSLTDPKTLPAVVVCPAHLTKQWEREVKRFIPRLTTHILKQTQPYKLPQFNGHGPDVIITSYHKMAGWSPVLQEYASSIIFDEAQELRHRGSDKYIACEAVAARCEYRLALSATPIYNYGGEIYNIINVIRPGALGTLHEFITEWCARNSDKPRLKEPAEFGDWLRNQGLMLRRTRSDVSRELPPLTNIVWPIDADSDVMNSIEARAVELASVMNDKNAAPLAKMQASSGLDLLLRQATGVAKAKHVAAFVKMLLDQEEPVVLFGWHLQVYDIWREELKHYRPAFYTGEESLNRKQEEVRRFLEKDTDLLIISLRSGAGLDGLQHRCRTVVFGELDWSPGVHEQCAGRVCRDGQPDPVTSYFLLSQSGSDPDMAEVLGVKREQSDGLRGIRHEAISQTDPAKAIRGLADRYLNLKKHR